MSVYMHANKQSWQLYCSEVASPPLPAQQPARAQLLRKAQEALGFEIKELVLVVSCDKCDWEYTYFIRRL